MILLFSELAPTLTDYYGWISLVIISLFALPIAFALVIKWKNSCLKHRQLANGAINCPMDIESPISTFSPPPTYIDLFPSSILQLSSTERIYAISDHNHPSTGIHNGNYTSENEIHVNMSNFTQDSSDGGTPRPTIRLPGMHISVFEIPSSNIYNSLNTPPPSYTEALVILGSSPHKQL